ncbi:hypothetical protein MASR2M18_16820 [Ignavibacteria bacterium]|nr:hypothetical protein [Bacteroidota bacterium]
MPDFEEFSPEDFSPQSSRERSRLSFKDFLVARELAGSFSGVPHGGLVPSEFIVDGGTKVEIIATPIAEADHEHEVESSQEPTVIIRRSPDNEIEAIEFSCSCGQKVIVKINYDDDKSVTE